MPRTRIHNLSISLDGFAAGEGQSAGTPMGHTGQRLHRWMIATDFGTRMMGGGDGGSTGVDDAIAHRHELGIGSEIMGANKFGPPGWQDDPDWTGWWGDNPPFRTPVFVLTHRPRAPIEMAGGTVFHFLDVPPAEALTVARDAAGGLDVRIGGGATRNGVGVRRRGRVPRAASPTSPSPAAPSEAGRTEQPRATLQTRREREKRRWHQRLDGSAPHGVNGIRHAE